jgi:hypothetical protein
MPCPLCYCCPCFCLSYRSFKKTFQTPCHAMLTRKFNKQTRQFWGKKHSYKQRGKAGEWCKGCKERARGSSYNASKSMTY